MRKLDLDQLKIWATNYRTLSEATSYLSVKTGIGFYALRRVFQGKREPKLVEQNEICKATGLSKDVLFPLRNEEKHIA